MKKLLTFILFLSLASATIYAQDIIWEKTGGPAGGYVRALARDSSENIFAGTSGGLFKSANDGESWELCENDIGYSLVYSLAVSPNGAIFAGTFYDGVFRSTDNGNSWTQLGSNVYFIVRALAIKSDGIIFAGDTESESGGGGSVYRSTNNGDSWIKLNGLPDSPVYQIKISADGSIFVGMKDGFFKSTNNGASWSLITNGIWITWISDLAISIVNNYIYVTGSNQSGSMVGIFRSTDNGNSFTQLVFPDVFAPTLGVSPAGHFFAATVGFIPSLNYGIYRSTDDGETFIKVDSTLSVKKFVFSLSDQVFGGTNLGVHLSIDDGETWQLKVSGMMGIEVSVIDSDQSVATYAGTLNGPYRTTDAGLTWERLESGFLLRSIKSIATNTLNDVFIVNDLGKVFRSTNLGETWTQLSISGPIGIIFAHTNDMLFFTAAFQGIYRSTDNGETWNLQNNGLPSPIDVVSLSNIPSGNIYIGTSDGLWRSTNNGELWTRLGTYNGYIDYFQVNTSEHLFWAWSDAYTDINYVNRSTDNGTTWQRLNVVPSNAGVVTDILITPNQDTYIVISNETVGGVYRSTDNGDNFISVSEGLTEKLLLSISMDEDEYVYVGSTRGVFRTSLITGSENNEKYPSSIILNQNYPNPFNPSTSIQYAISNRQFVLLKVYDILGDEIETLVNEEKPAGTYEVTWSAESLPSGVYFYQLSADSYIETKKMILIK